MIIVGSSALKYFSMNRNKPNDLDMWQLEDDFKLYEFFSDEKQDRSIVPEDIYKLVPTVCGYATPDAVYTIKCSHLGWSNPMWDKHKLDIIWLESKGCKLLPELYERLLEHWKVEFNGKEFLSLKQTKEDFFTDNVTYRFDHDYLHELVAFPNKPMYTNILRENEEVLLDKSKFDKLPLEDKVRLFKEEITVIACERWLLNDYWKGKVSWYKAYKLSLKKTITTLTKGWATSFIVLNLKEFLKPEYSYFENVLHTLMKEEIEMSKVDMSVFEEVQTYLGIEESLSNLVYQMCENDLCTYNSDIMVNEYVWYKERDQPDYESRLALYNEERAKLEEEFSELFEYQHLDQDGGGEGGSEDCYGVFKLKGKIYRAEYSYYSHHGHDYDYILDTLREVKPVQKTITVYE